MKDTFHWTHSADEICFNRRSGTRKYHKKNKTYSLERDAGLFSNLNLAILEIFMLEKTLLQVIRW